MTTLELHLTSLFAEKLRISEKSRINKVTKIVLIIDPIILVIDLEF